MNWKRNFLNTLRDLAVANPRFRLSYQTTLLGMLLCFFQKVTLLTHAYQRVGFLSPLSDHLHLRGDVGDSPWGRMTVFQRYCYLRWVSEYLRLRRREGRLRFYLKYAFWPPFRQEVLQACYFQVICCYVERRYILSQVRLVLIEEMFELSLPWISEEKLQKWIRAHASKVRRHPDYRLGKQFQIPLEYLGDYATL